MKVKVGCCLKIWVFIFKILRVNKMFYSGNLRRQANSDLLDDDDDYEVDDETDEYRVDDPDPEDEETNANIPMPDIVPDIDYVHGDFEGVINSDHSE